MAGKDEGGPPLELPSFGFGRKRRKDAAASAAEPAPEPVPEPGPEPVPEPVPEPATETTSEPVTQPVTQPVAEPDLEAPPAAEPTRGPLFVDQVQEPAPSTAAEPASPPGERKPRKPRQARLPALAGMPAAVVTGVLVGLLTVGLTWGGMQGCEALRGTSTCGQPGYLLVAAILVLMVLTGSWLLRAWQVADPGSTSFLAVGLTAVIAMLFLINELEQWWMVIVIPVISALTFALSHWVTTTFIEPADR